MTRWLGGVLAVALMCGAAAGTARADDAAPSGEEIMRRVDARPRGKTQNSHAVWHLFASDGSERVRETRNYWRDARGTGDGRLKSQRLIVFEQPPDVKDTAFLTWSASDSAVDDDQWIYLPALRKVRRIAVGDRGAAFVGTDFCYDDLADRLVEADEHRLLRSEEREGQRYYVVESTPRKKPAPYQKRVVYVNASNWTLSRIEYFAPSGEQEKTLEIRWREVQGIWTWESLEMSNPHSGHRTRVEIEQVVYDRPLGEDFFTENTMRAGVP
ncbi:MAG TPA: outer membrane lipoprotein-sorting protein [Myxococcota bacterium]|nr:outer membrane lipoprotein-sorting protein [Myxococcota bacterium]